MQWPNRTPPRGSRARGRADLAQLGQAPAHPPRGAHEGSACRSRSEECIGIARDTWGNRHAPVGDDSSGGRARADAGVRRAAAVSGAGKLAVARGRDPERARQPRGVREPAARERLLQAHGPTRDPLRLRPVRGWVLLVSLARVRPPRDLRQPHAAVVPADTSRRGGPGDLAAAPGCRGLLRPARIHARRPRHAPAGLAGTLRAWPQRDPHRHPAGSDRPHQLAGAAGLERARGGLLLRRRPALLLQPAPRHRAAAIGLAGEEHRVPGGRAASLAWPRGAGGAIDDLTFVPGSGELENQLFGFLSVPIRRDADLRDIEPFVRAGVYTAHGWRQGFTLIGGISLTWALPMERRAP